MLRRAGDAICVKFKTGVQNPKPGSECTFLKVHPDPVFQGFCPPDWADGMSAANVPFDD